MSLPLSVVILTYNEEVNLPTCLESLKALGCEIFIVDSGSTDRTVEIAEKAGAKVLFHAFENQAAQFNWALSNLPLTTEWVMRMDADEWVTPELVEELTAKLKTLPPEVTGLYVKRRNYFMGRWMRHGGYYPTWLLRVWRRGKAVCEPRQMDEHIVLTEGIPVRLTQDIVDDNQKDLFYWVDKHNRFSSRWVELHLRAEKAISGHEIRPGFWGSQDARKRWIKIHVYDRAPKFARALAYWVYRYWLRLGFLDGKEGLIFHFLQGFWYRFLIDAKLYEKQKKSSRKSSASSDPGFEG